MEELLDLAVTAPDLAAVQARAILTESTHPLGRSYAHHALAIVLRDGGDLVAAARAARAGMADARQAHDPARERDIQATYGTILLYGGRTRVGLSHLERAADGAEGEVGAKILMRYGASLSKLDRYEESLRPLRGAAAMFHGLGNPLWETRSLIWLAHSALMLGRVAEAGAHLEAAMALQPEVSSVDRLDVMSNLAAVAEVRNDLATCLRILAEVRAGHLAAGTAVTFDQVGWHAEALIAAGLAVDAAELLEATDPNGLALYDRAQLELSLAATRLAAGNLTAAVKHGQHATRLFRRLDRRWYVLRARLVVLRAQFILKSGRKDHAAAVAAALHDERAPEAPLALMLAGRLSRGQDRAHWWQLAATYRNDPNALVRAAGWEARALERDEMSDRGGVLRAARAGLSAIDEHRRLMGSTELRALATDHGRELTTLALRHAAADPRTLLAWSERTRATTLAVSRVTSDAATVPASLAALRENGRRLAEARQEGEPTDHLERERLRLERAVRHESHGVSAAAAEQRPVRAEEVVAEVGDGCLVELVDVDGVLHVLVVHAGRVRRRVAGPVADALALLDAVAMQLRRAARGRAVDLGPVGIRLQTAILGDATRLIPDGPVVIAPTARLHGLPWAILPTLTDRPFSVSPSAGQWLRAWSTPRPAAGRRRTVLVAGPGLETGGAEVPLLADRHPDATLLTGPDATLTQVLADLDGADLVHLATHGHFRADSPLFSSLDLADGPLTVHDLERIGRAPYRVVLSACESGVLAPVGAQELLGLASSLFSLGTAGLVSSVAEVNDAATAELMVGLHASLARGNDPATALHEVRCQVAGDSVAAGTAAAFVALGV